MMLRLRQIVAGVSLLLIFLLLMTANICGWICGFAFLRENQMLLLGSRLIGFISVIGVMVNLLLKLLVQLSHLLIVK
jgi:hypothetical protein